jgi:hypothetical protein
MAAYFGFRWAISRIVAMLRGSFAASWPAAVVMA